MRVCGVINLYVAGYRRKKDVESVYVKVEEK